MGSFLNGWDYSRLEKVLNPIMKEKSFKLRIEITEHAYKIYVDGRFIYKFHNRNPPYTSVKSLLLVGIKLDDKRRGCKKNNRSRPQQSGKMHVTIYRHTVQTRYSY
ncbi:unnamed protein product [Caenorhabditis auriculariae]|uniref:Galectin n=1 Tax=Caenorhabditis auriculariae TaxID=2777116 RepID=A0A8S1GSB0_9PELO|nr:unnamed protein product [Caenorhabditis auriculariae]